MREIKFKGYERGTDNVSYWCSDDGDNGFWESVGIFHQKYDLVQYTGLKDKNGKEIYEDDILSIGIEKDYAQIKSVSGGFVLVRKFWWNDPYFPQMGHALADMQTKSWVQDNCEVIGSIYENKELLNEL